MGVGSAEAKSRSKLLIRFAWVFRVSIGSKLPRDRQRRNAMKGIGQSLLLTSALLLSVSIPGAQHLGPSSADSNYTISKDLPGVSGVTVHAGTPAGFEPTDAFDEEWQANGYPRQPDPDDTKADVARRASGGYHSRRRRAPAQSGKISQSTLGHTLERKKHLESRIRQLGRLFPGRRKPGVRSSRSSLGSHEHRLRSRVVHERQLHVARSRW